MAQADLSRASLSAALLSAVILSPALGACAGSRGDAPPRVERPVPPSSAAPRSAPVARGRGVVWDPNELAAGTGHTCAIRAHGQVMCWGHNEGGQIGDGSTTARPAPELVQGVDGASTLSAGAQHSCAIVEAGRIRCWGGATIGAGRSIGVRPIGDIEDAVEIVSSTWLACARRRSGDVVCWSSDGAPRVVADFKGAKELAAGASEVCALLADGAVRCAAAPISGLKAARPVDDVKGAVQIAVLATSACALMPEGRLRCWGFEQRFDEELPTPAIELEGLSDVRELASAWSRFCAATASGATCFGEVVAGRGAKGRPAIGGLELTDAPELRRYASIAAGPLHTCGGGADGAIACWGPDASLLGSYPEAGARAEPTEVRGVSDAVELLAGEDATCARRANGHVACWGGGPFGSPSSNGDAVDVVGIDDATGLAGGQQFACAVRGHQQPSCWGIATFRACAWSSPDNCQSERIPTPRPFAHLLDVPGAVAISDRCAVRANGMVACLDRDRPGQVTARNIAGVRGAKAVAGWCALDGAGAVSCWGHNELGQLGDGSRYTRPDASTVYGVSDVVQIATGAAHACARRKDGTVACWGANASGQLGDGSRVDRARPVPVTTLSGATQIALGASFSCALGSDRSVRCWGSNEHGALGDGSARDQSKPALVAHLTDAVEIAAGYDHACARRASGAVSCWGRTASATPDAVAPSAPRRVLDPPALSGLSRDETTPARAAISGRPGLARP